ncbi:MAG: hypothetical protein ACTHKR_09800 [Sphingomonas sp.]
MSEKFAAAFIVTKPLQLLNALNLAEQEGILNRSNFLIVDTFADSKLIFSNAADQDWAGAKWTFLQSRNDITKHFKKEKYDTVFVDSDVGIANLWFLLKIKIWSRAKRIKVYEEGVGSYRNDLYPPIKGRIYRILGIGSYFGGCLFTSAVYVFDPLLYISRLPFAKRRVKRIKTPLGEFFKRHEETIKSIVAYPDALLPRGGGDCHIYLTSWVVNEAFLKAFSRSAGVRVIKPHPAIRQPEMMFGAVDGIIVPGRIPAEVLLLDALEKFPNVVVYHEGSSASAYIKHEAIKYVDVSGAI